jgi:hypothetical protein
MSSEVEICNLALSHIGTRSTISALNENSNEARQCNIHYAAARDFVLRKHPWGFAEKTLALAVLSDPPPNWLYKYQYPTDCVTAIELVPEDKALSPPIPYKLGVADDRNSKTILTDKEDAYLRYTARVTNPTLFDAAFVQALSWYLASQLALPLTASKSIRADAVNGYLLMTGQAETADLNEGEPDPEREASWTEGRN